MIDDNHFVLYYVITKETGVIPLHGAGASVHHVALQEDAVSKKLRVTQ
jgi:hypothetical protein